MTQMYVITAGGGSYDDAWERAEFVTDNQTKGEEYVARQNKLSEEVITANEQTEVAMQHWRKVNPCPERPSYTELAVPKFDGVKNITQAMRKERDDIRAQNSKMLSESMEPVNKWYRSQNEARITYRTATFRPEVIEGMERGYHDTTWSIEPIAWLE